MIIEKINKDIDVITPGEPDINNMNVFDLIDLIETENKLYYLERIKRKHKRASKRKF